jgi:hypothetical protein
MAKRSIARLFDTSEHARMAVSDLEQAGFHHDDISYMGGEGATTANDPSIGTSATGTRTDRRGETGADTGAATGATLGTVLGGGAGLLAGLGALAIPGIGPVVAAGWLIAALTGAGAGAAAGGLLGGLAGAGFGEEDATTYAEGVRRGGHLVVIRADEARASEAEQILDRHGPIDINRRSQDWRSEGWEAGNTTTTGTTTTGTTTGTTNAGVTSGTVGGNMVGTAGGLGGGMAAPGLNDDVAGANDPTRRRPGDVA